MNCQLRNLCRVGMGMGVTSFELAQRPFFAMPRGRKRKIFTVGTNQAILGNTFSLSYVLPFRLLQMHLVPVGHLEFGPVSALVPFGPSLVFLSNAESFLPNVNLRKKSSVRFTVVSDLTAQNLHCEEKIPSKYVLYPTNIACVNLVTKVFTSLYMALGTPRQVLRVVI